MMLWSAQDIGGDTLQLTAGEVCRLVAGDYVDILNGRRTGRYTVVAVHLNEEPVRLTLSPFAHVVPVGVLGKDIAKSPTLRVKYT